MTARVLIVERHGNEAMHLREELRSTSYRIDLTHTAAEALEICATTLHPDLLLIDFDLPDMPGTELCRRIRHSPRIGLVPVVLLSTRDQDIDRVVAFELGVDDYISQPFDGRELRLRIQAILRRCYGIHEEAREIRAGRLLLNRDSHRIWVGSTLIKLTQIEFRLLEVLMLRRGRGQSRERLLQDVWGRSADGRARTVDTHIRRLREKLGSLANYIRTIRGLGYSFGDLDEPVSPASHETETKL